MSAYKKIKCKIVNQELLVEALDTLGLKATVNESTKKLRNYTGKETKSRAYIVASRAEINENFTGASNDIGFQWNEDTKSYDIICSEYDAALQMHQRIIQAYAKVAIEKALTANRFSIETTSNEKLRSRQRTKIEVIAKKVI